MDKHFKWQTFKILITFKTKYFFKCILDDNTVYTYLTLNYKDV